MKWDLKNDSLIFFLHNKLHGWWCLSLSNGEDNILKWNCDIRQQYICFFLKWCLSHMFLQLKVWLPRVSFHVYMIKLTIVNSLWILISLNIQLDIVWPTETMMNSYYLGGKIHGFLRCPKSIDPTRTASSESQVFFPKSQSCNHSDIFYFWIYTRLIPWPRNWPRHLILWKDYPSTPTPTPAPAKWLFQSCHQSLTQAVGMAKNWQAYCFEELDVEEAPITSHISLSHWKSSVAKNTQY